MRKSVSFLVAIIIVIALAVGAYAIFHKSNKTTPAATTSSTNTPKRNAPAVNNSVLVTKTDSKLGQYLADPSGKALYTYGNDSNGVSNCTGVCLTNWPAYVASGSTQNLPAGVGTITRSDSGKLQYTYNGMPLYYFASDAGGKVTGNGVDNFHVARPSSSSSSSSSSSTNSSSSSSSSSSSTSSGYPY